MKNDSYVESLPNILNKDQILDAIRNTRADLKDSTIPMFKNAVDVFGSTSDFKTDIIKPLQDRYSQLTNSRASFVKDVFEAVKKLPDLLDDIDDLVNKSFNDEIAAGGTTYREANVLQMIEAISFVSRFARKVLIYTYTAESSEKASEQIKFDESISKGEQEIIRSQFSDFVYALMSVDIPTKKFLEGIDEIPEVVVTRDNIRTLAVTSGEAAIDPFKMRFFNVTNNFIYKLMLRFAEWQADRYKEAIEEKRMVEYRHLLLLRQRSGKEDARLEREIYVSETRISKLTYKIQKMESKNA